MRHSSHPKRLWTALAGICLCCMLLAFSGCGKQKAKDIVVGDLKSACEFVDAMEIVIDEVTALMAGNLDREALDAEKAKEFEALSLKLDELDDAARKKFSKSEASSCPNWGRLQEKGDKLDGVFH